MGVIIHILPEFFYVHQNRQKMMKKKSQLFKKANLWQINLSKNTFTFIQYVNFLKNTDKKFIFNN